MNVKNGVKGLGARSTDIIEVENADFQTFFDLFKSLREEIVENSRNGKKTLIFLYYAGHGLMTNTTQAVCNGAFDI